MPILECSIAPPDEDEESSRNDYPAIKYLVLAILFFIVSRFTFLRDGKKSRKGAGIPADIDNSGGNYGKGTRNQPRI